MDGNYGGTLDLRLAATDAVGFISRGLYVWHVISRRLRHARRSRPDIAPACPERLTPRFGYPTERRPGILRNLERLPEEKTVFVPRSPAEVERLLDSVKKFPQTLANR